MAISWSGWYWSLGVAIGGAIASGGDCAIAQVTPDGTLPNNSIVTLSGNTNLIEGGTEAGSNLFHSFEQFSVPTGGEANFNNALNIQNIISRVTGASISNIDGLLRANGTANLFLLNPNGVIFGPQATLSIGGSFVGSTASSLSFADGTSFSASVPTTTPLLSVSVPIGLQYGGTTGSIINQSRTNDTSSGRSGLQVQPGKTLALMGSDVSLEGGYLIAPGGRVELGGVAGVGTVGLNVDGSNVRLNFPNNVARADVSVHNSSVSTQPTNDNNGGSITISARNLILEESVIQSSIFSAVNAGNIEINATGTILSKDTNFISQGSSGKVVVQANSISLINSFLSLGSFGGSGGIISVQADDSVSLAGGVLTVNGGVSGIGGEINIQARSVSLTDGAAVTAFSSYGNAGKININASDSISIRSRSNVNADSQTQGGNVNIRARSFTLTDGAQVNVRSRGGNAGNIVIVADSVTISGFSSSGPQFQSGISIGSSSGLFSNLEEGFDYSYLEPSGQSGDIRIDTATLHVSDGAVVSAITKSDGGGGNIVVSSNTLEVTGGGQILTTTYSNGPPGDIIINATNSLTLSGSDPTFAERLNRFGKDVVSNEGPTSGLFASAAVQSTGQGGDLRIATEKLSVRDGAEVTVSSLGSGNAGNLEITSRDLLLDNRGALRATSVSGRGGNISLEQDLIQMLNNSEISVTAGPNGYAGNLSIDTDFLIAAGNSDFIINLEGFGGNLIVSTLGFFLSPDSDIIIDSGEEIQLQNPDPLGRVVVSPREVVDVTGLIATDCPTSVRRGESKFIITGRGGLPPNPRQVLSSNAVQVDWVKLDASRENRASATPATNSTKESTPTTIVEANGWITNHKGEVILTATVPSSTLDIPWVPKSDCNAPKPKS